MTFQRITTDPDVFSGKPCIRGLRFPVSRLLGLLAGKTRESILASHPYLEAEDVQEALRHAHPCYPASDHRHVGERERALTRTAGSRRGRRVQP